MCDNECSLIGAFVGAVSLIWNAHGYEDMTEQTNVCASVYVCFMLKKYRCNVSGGLLPILWPLHLFVSVVLVTVKCIALTL